MPNYSHYRVQRRKCFFTLKTKYNLNRSAQRTLLVYPKARHGVVVMTNSGYADIGKISTAIYSALNAK